LVPLAWLRQAARRARVVAGLNSHGRKAQKFLPRFFQKARAFFSLFSSLMTFP
jgi:hypothetical protein